MKINLTFPSLDALRKEMGASLSRAFLIRNEKLRDTYEAFQLEKMSSHSTGALLYDNEAVVLYIGKNKYGDLNNWASRYHLMECSTIRGMYSSGRRFRYQVSSRRDGRFYVSTSKFQDRLAKLYICGNCFNALPYHVRMHAGRTQGVFSLAKYFDLMDETT